mmetsp:Transcript_43803/g.92100  ORF Transcript_43803/g.92100 Transcript_43803/m.92100 type:complete len:220 (-) Transcript_43803:90-749(-)
MRDSCNNVAGVSPSTTSAWGGKADSSFLLRSKAAETAEGPASSASSASYSLLPSASSSPEEDCFPLPGGLRSSFPLADADDVAEAPPPPAPNDDFNLSFLFSFFFFFSSASFFFFSPAAVSVSFSSSFSNNPYLGRSASNPSVRETNALASVAAAAAASLAEGSAGRAVERGGSLSSNNIVRSSESEEEDVEDASWWSSPRRSDGFRSRENGEGPPLTM